MVIESLNDMQLNFVWMRMVVFGIAAADGHSAEPERNGPNVQQVFAVNLREGMSFKRKVGTAYQQRMRILLLGLKMD